jgi:hypothetical protein
MKEAAIQVGGVQFPLDAKGEFVMEILYVTHDFRKSKKRKLYLGNMWVTGYSA